MSAPFWTMEPLEKFRLERDDARDLTFLGWMIGEGEVGTGARRELTVDPDDEDPAEFAYERGTTVRIYVVAPSDKLVVHVIRWLHWGEIEKFELAVVDGPEHLLEALTASNGGKLGSASRQAWNQACEKYPPLQPLATESLE